MDKKLKYKSEGEMLFGGKTKSTSNNFLNFKDLYNNSDVTKRNRNGQTKSGFCNSPIISYVIRSFPFTTFIVN